MNAIHPAEYQAALRADFYSFLLRCFAELNPRLPFLANWHIEVLAATLQAAQEGKINRLVVASPRVISNRSPHRLHFLHGGSAMIRHARSLT